jgi:SAM-dependent methyltransferase
MHDTALFYGKKFFQNYLLKPSKILDVGSKNENGSLKFYCGDTHEYIGIDMIAGDNVDIIQKDPYVLPFNDNTFDIITSTSVFEHSQMFWVLANEIFRVLKPDGLFYLNAPSNGPYHTYPVDCYRFYPDAGKGIVEWGVYSGYKNLTVLESFIGDKKNDNWNDFICIFLKDKYFADKYPFRIINKHKSFIFGRKDSDPVLYQAKIKDNASLMPDQKVSGILKMLLIKIKFLLSEIFKRVFFLRKIRKIYKNIYKKNA